MAQFNHKFTLDDYIITKDGKVFNKHNMKELTQRPNSKGYMRVQMLKKQFFVHRLVANKYIPNLNNLPQVNHKDGNKMNNSVDNLEWCTNKENREHAVKHGLHLKGEACPWTKLSWEKADYIRSNYPKYNMRELGEQLGVSRSLVADVLHNRAWVK